MGIIIITIVNLQLGKITCRKISLGAQDQVAGEQQS